MKKQNNMRLLEIILLVFGLSFCFVNSNEECNNELDSDCFCYDEPGHNNEYSICVDQPKKSDSCLSDHLGVNYRMVGQRCIYFDKSTSNHTVARERCKSTFSGKGRMYEPRSFEESKEIALEGQSKLSRTVWWLGVNISTKRKFVFNSDGSPIPFTPTLYRANAQSGPGCVYGWYQFWNIFPCSDISNFGTLCEYGE